MQLVHKTKSESGYIQLGWWSEWYSMKWLRMYDCIQWTMLNTERHQLGTQMAGEGAAPDYRFSMYAFVSC